MYRNERYEDNVVLKREALQELLTNIRNYPIIDIDYLEETEKDYSYTPEGATVPQEATYWDRYTEGVPCIRITYGDPETDKGKIALAGTGIRATIEGLKKQIADLTTTLIQQEEQRARWIRVKEENERLKDKKIQEISAYMLMRETLNEDDAFKITKKYEEFTITLNENSESVPLLGSLTLLNEYPIDLDRIKLVLNKGNNANVTEVISEGKKYYFPNTLPSLVIPESAFGTDGTITLYVLNDYLNVLAQISTARQLILQYCSEAKRGEEPAVQTAIDNICNQSIAALNALELVFRDYNTWLTGGFIDASDTTSVDVAQYDGGQITHGSRTKSTYDTIKTYIDQYINDEIQEKINRASQKINTLNNQIVNTKSQIENKKTAIQNAQDSITVSDAQKNGIKGYKYVKVGSNIQWDKNISFSEIDNPDSTLQKNGYFRVTINGHTYEIGIKGFEQSDNSNLKATASIIPNTKYTSDSAPGYNLGSSELPWHQIYGDKGYFSEIHIGDITIGGSSGSNGGPTPSFLGQNGWTNQLTGVLEFGTMSGTDFTSNVKISNNTNDGITGTTNGDSLPATIAKNTAASIYTKGGICAEYNIWAKRVFNAVFNDYAECRSTIDLTPGHVVIDQDDGSLACSSKRLQPGAQVISDTYGHLMGGTDKAKTPIAVAGRVLVYAYQPRENYHAGMAVCSAPDGTVDIMTREEIRDYPDCIVGIVSEIPQYETWGSDNVKVDGRIWIKVK